MLTLDVYSWYTHKTSGFKTSGFKTSETSGLQNVRFTKCQVYKTSGLQNVRWQKNIHIYSVLVVGGNPQLLLQPCLQAKWWLFFILYFRGFCLISISNLKTGRFETWRFETWRFVNLTFCKPDVLKPNVLKPDVLKPDVMKPDVLWVYRILLYYISYCTCWLRWKDVNILLVWNKNWKIYSLFWITFDKKMFRFLTVLCALSLLS